MMRRRVTLHAAAFLPMTISIILGRKPGSQAVRVVSAPTDPTTQNKKFNAMTVGDGDGWEEIYLHELKLTDGRKRKIFRPRASGRSNSVR
jgi:hypothetical protein